MMKKFLRFGLLCTIFFLLSCGSRQKKLEMANEQLVEQVQLCNDRLDKLLTEIKYLEKKVEDQRKIAAKNAAISAKDKEPLIRAYTKD